MNIWKAYKALPTLNIDFWCGYVLNAGDMK